MGIHCRAASNGVSSSGKTSRLSWEFVFGVLQEVFLSGGIRRRLREFVARRRPGVFPSGGELKRLSGEFLWKCVKTEKEAFRGIPMEMCEDR